jgi:hypothetical protein
MKIKTATAETGAAAQTHTLMMQHQKWLLSESTAYLRFTLFAGGNVVCLGE